MADMEGVPLDENGIPIGFSLPKPRAPKGTGFSAETTNKLIEHTGGELAPEVSLKLDQPVTAPTFTTSAEGDIKNPHNRGVQLQCEAQGQGKHSGPATHFLSNAADSDLISTPYALCQKHLRRAQEKNAGDPNFTLTEIKPQDVEKHRSKLLAMKTATRLSMMQSLMTGGYAVKVPAGTPEPPANVQLGKADLLWGKETERFGARGASLKTERETALGRRTPEEQSAILEHGLSNLRGLTATPEQHEAHMDFHEKNPGETCPVCAQADEDFVSKVEEAGVKAKGTSHYTGYVFKRKNLRGADRVSKFGAPPTGPEVTDPSVIGSSTPIAPSRREHAGTNEPNKTWESVGYGDVQSLIENLPAHLTTYDQATGALRPLTPSERFVESRYDQEQSDLRALRAQNETAKALRSKATLRSLPLAERMKAEAKIRRKGLGNGKRTEEFKAIEGPSEES